MRLEKRNILIVAKAMKQKFCSNKDLHFLSWWVFGMVSKLFSILENPRVTILDWVCTKSTWNSRRRGKKSTLGPRCLGVVIFVFSSLENSRVTISDRMWKKFTWNSRRRSSPSHHEHKVPSSKNWSHFDEYFPSYKFFIFRSNEIHFVKCIFFRGKCSFHLLYISLGHTLSWRSPKSNAIQHLVTWAPIREQTHSHLRTLAVVPKFKIFQILFELCN